MSQFTGHKDTDRLILSRLNGEALLSFCSSTPYLNNLCSEEFFQGKIRNTPLEKLKVKYPSLNYRNFYATMMYYIALLQEKYDFKYDFTDLDARDPKDLYQLLQKYKNLTHLLSDASAEGDLELVKYSIEQAADIHDDDDDALTQASYSGHLDVVKYLVEHGADIHARQDFALRLAIEKNRLDIVKYLVEHGANIHAKNDLALK